VSREASNGSSSGSLLLLLCEEEAPGAGRRIPVSLLYSGLAIGGTLANGLVIYLVSSFRKLQTTSNAFIVNGCAADLSLCALWMPQEAVLGLLPGGAAGPPDARGPAGSPASPAGYRLLRGGLLGLGLTVSLLSHCLVALNRYLLITRTPATYQALYRRRRTAGMLALSWLLALGLVLLLPPWTPPAGAAAPTPHGPALLAAAGLLAQTALLGHCYLGIVRRVRVSVKRVSVLNFHLLHQLPGCAAGAAAAAAFPGPGGGSAAGPGGGPGGQPPPLPPSLHPRRAQRRLNGLSVLLLCCVFLLATQPLLWVSAASGFSLPVPWGVEAASWLLCCALSALNPLLYTWKNEEFRRSVRSVLPGVGDAAATAAAAAATAIPAVSQAQLGTRPAGQHWSPHC
uniref:G protein-coupled receptor 88 n=1 Tax=Ornithorhynchus anatinus TaxID=9258 RepID=A0A6I8NDH1_ORNAN